MKTKSKTEISSTSFLNFLLDIVADAPGGKMRQEEVAERIEDAFGYAFTAEDRKMFRGRPKWLNTLDWAKAIGQKKRLLATVKIYPKTGEETWILRTDEVWLKWYEGKRRKPSFTQRCKSCGAVNRLGRKECRACGKPFVRSERQLVRPK